MPDDFFDWTPVSTDVLGTDTSPTFSSAGVVPADNTADNPLGFFQNLLSTGVGLYGAISTAQAQKDAAQAAADLEKLKAQNAADLARAQTAAQIAAIQARASALQTGAINWQGYMPWIVGGIGVIVLVKLLKKK